MNLVFISGPHGAGKSTLADRIAESDDKILIPELKTNTPKLETDVVVERTTMKICQRAMENYELTETARKNPGKIIFGNRCNHDVEAYSRAFLNLGWISQKEHEQLISFSLYAHNFVSQRAIIYNPPYEIVVERLQKRWKTEKKKWREDNLDYLHAVCKAFEMFKGRPNILYLDGNVDLGQTVSWMKNSSSKMPEDSPVLAQSI